MDRKAAKELVHIQGWLDRVDEIIERGKETYLADDLLQEAGGGQAHRAALTPGRAPADAPGPEPMWLRGRAGRNRRGSAPLTG